MLYKVTRVARRDHEKSRGKKRWNSALRVCTLLPGRRFTIIIRLLYKGAYSVYFHCFDAGCRLGVYYPAINLFGFFNALDSLFRKWLYGYNLFRAAGDIYIIVKFSRFPKDILVISWCRHESVFSEPEKFLTSLIWLWKTGRRFAVSFFCARVWFRR